MKAIVTLLAAAATTITFSAAQAQSPNTPGSNLDHYQCYRLSPISRFRQRKVKLTDQFGASQAVVVRAQFRCAPVAKNGESMTNQESHLVCYGATGGTDARKR